MEMFQIIALRFQCNYLVHMGTNGISTERLQVGTREYLHGVRAYHICIQRGPESELSLHGKYF